MVDNFGKHMHVRVNYFKDMTIVMQPITYSISVKLPPFNKIQWTRHRKPKSLGLHLLQNWQNCPKFKSKIFDARISELYSRI